MSTSSELSALSDLSKTPTPPPDSNVPDDDDDAERDIGSQQWGKQDPILFTLPNIHSASKLSLLDFTAMRASWPKISKAGELPKHLFDPEITEKAREVTTSFPELKAYLRQVGQPDTGVVHRDMGVFLLVRDSQKRIPLEPAEGRQWLQSDSAHMEPSLAQTRKKRKISQPDFLGMAFGDNSMAARLDGYLEANGEVFAIAEVKPNIRDPVKRPEVLWQETGEMIAWIVHDDNHERKCRLRRRLLVSQDNHEIFLTIADYDKRYLAYLKNGPWSINHPSHMEDLAMIILCVAFEVTYDLASSANSQQN